MTRTASSILILGLLLLLFVTLAEAQTTSGTLTGIVTDPSQAAVPGAAVSARNQDTGFTREAQASVAGVYSLSLPPGIYDISVETTGFKKLQRRGVQIFVNQTVRLDLQLELGQLTETVTIEADAQLIQTETTEMGTVFSNKEVLGLPLSTPGQRRMADTFMLLVPGVSTGGGAGGNNAALNWNMGGQWTVNGSQEDSKEILYEGLSIGNIHSGGRMWAQSPPPDAIQEFKMVTGTYSAEFGRSQAGIFSIKMRSGGNELHGSIYNFLRNDALHARGFFTPTKAKDRQNEFGGQLGGPIYIPRVYDGRNKTFFHFFYNGMRWRTASANELVTVPRQAFLRGDFSRHDFPIYDPLTNAPDPAGGVKRDLFPGNQIPSSRFSTVSKNVAALLPAEMFDFNTRNFLGIRTTESDDDRFQVKFDHNLNQNQRLAVLYSRGVFIRRGSGPLPQPFFSGFTTRDEKAHIGRISHDYTINPTTINQFSAGFNRDAPLTASPTVGEGWPAKLGITGVGDVEGGAFPHILFGNDVQDGIRLGGEANSFQAEESFMFAETLTMVRGKHTLKMGGDLRRHRFNVRTQHRTHGTFNFSSGLTSLPNSPDRGRTGSGVASFLLGAVNNAASLFPTVVPGTRNWYYSMFVQDDYKVTRKLTLNLGLRWEVATPMVERTNRVSFFSPTEPNPGAGGLPGALIFANDNLRTVVDTYYKGFGPRVGLAYKLTPKTVIRTGYGIFYGLGGASTENGVGSSFQVGFDAFPTPSTLDGGITPAFYWDNGFPQDFPKPPRTIPEFANGTTLNNYIRPEDGNPPYIQNWQFGLQQELGSNLLAEVAYVGSKGTRLPSKLFRPNQLHPSYLALGDLLNDGINSAGAQAAGIMPPYPGFNGPVRQALLPFPHFLGGLNDAYETLGMSTYNSMQVLVRKRYSQGFVFQFAYTLSKKINDGSERQNVAGNSAPVDYYNLALEKSLSWNDSTHIAAFGYSYELPFGPGKPFLSGGSAVLMKLIGGWQLSGMHRYQSGFPFRVSGGNVGRPTFVSGQPIRTSIAPADFDPAKDRYYNIAAFSNGPRFAYGDVPRTLNERSFPFFDESISFIKNIKMGERVNLEYRAEFYNVLNRVNFSNPNNSINSSAFGTVSSQLGNPRQGQMALRLSF